MERRIGEVFKCDGVKLIVVESAPLRHCNYCYFRNKNNMSCSAALIKDVGFCHSYNRDDGKNVFFEEVQSFKQEESEEDKILQDELVQESETQAPEEESLEDESPTEQPTTDEAKPFKNDRINGKPRWELLPLPDLEDVVKVYTFGAEKYEPNSWRGLEDGFERYKAALLRHLVSFENGEELDEESGLPALAHMAWNAIAMLAIWHDKNKDKLDKNENHG